MLKASSMIRPRDIEESRRSDLVDLATAVAAAVAMTGVLWFWMSRGLSMAIRAAIPSAATVLAAIVGLWAPTLEPGSLKTFAESIRREAGSAPLAFYPDDKLALCFHLRRTIRVYGTEAELQSAWAAAPELVVVMDAERSRTPPRLRPGNTVCTFSTRKHDYFVLRCPTVNP
jgi:hypothetical protein